MRQRINHFRFLPLLLFLYPATKLPFLCDGRKTESLKKPKTLDLITLSRLDSYPTDSSFPSPFPPNDYIIGPSSSSSPQIFSPFCVLPPPFPLTPIPPSAIFPPTFPPFIIPSPPEYIPSPPEYIPSPPEPFPGTPTVLPGPPGFQPTPPSSEPSPPGFEPSPPGFGPSPPSGLVPSPPEFVPGPPIFLPPVIYPPPNVPPPPHAMTTPGLWCVAKPTVPDPIILEAMNYACGSGADCESILPNGSCYQPDTLIAHASFAFNSYWQRTKVAGGTCDFGGTAMLITRDPSYDGCHFLIS